MVVTNKHYAVKDISAPQESKESYNTQSEVLTVQVEGNATAVEIEVLGASDLQAEEFYPLMGFDLTTLGSSNTIEATGLYQFGIDGIAKYKFNITSVSGGTISIFCRETRG